MLADLPAHLLRIAHARVVTIVRRAERRTDHKRVILHPGETVAVPFGSAHARVIVRLDPCPLCCGSRRSPETGLPCEVCTLHPGSSYPVIP